MKLAGPGLRFIAKFTAGVDDVDLGAATNLGIMVTHATTESNLGGEGVGGAMGMMLALLTWQTRNWASANPRFEHDRKLCAFKKVRT